jgi:predicted nucleic acid-binding protein
MNAIDTNVLVYALDAKEPHKRHLATQLLRKLARDAEPVILLWQVAVEYVACLRRWENLGRISRNETLTAVSRMESTFECVLPTQNLSPLSFDLSSTYSLSYWDSLLIAACLNAGVTTLYSEDLGAGDTYESVRVVNPF